MRNIAKRIISVFFIIVLLFGVLPPAFAAGATSQKEEVIYVNLDHAGNQTGVYIVNSFTDKQITDYGDYIDTKNMNTSDQIITDGDHISISTNANKLYYEGILATDTAIPWNIDIHYYLDGIEYQASDLADKSGALKITMDITKNTACNSTFFENYALQASLTLDTNRCSNIVANDATIANVGNNKQLTYTILPNKGANIIVQADVTDFEMDAISINGIKLNLNIDIDDSQLQNKIDEIINAVFDLDNGAGKLQDGSNELYDATQTLTDKVGELNTGVGKLVNGAETLNDGLSAITSKNSTLIAGALSAYEGLCAAAQTALNMQLAEYGLGSITLTPETYSAVLSDLLKQLDADTAYNQAYHTALAKVTQQVEAQADTLYKEYVQSQANSLYFTYLQSQADALYTQVAANAICTQLIEQGYSPQQAESYLQTQEGQLLIAQTLANMSDEQKSQIINSAIAQLTTEQKQQILEGALASLTEDQKLQIRNGYIEQLMTSDEITQQITAAVAQVSDAASKIAQLKGQLDSYGSFYQGLIDYTSAVDDAAKGANTLKINLDTLSQNTGKLDVSVGDLNDAIKELFDGTAELKDGTSEFVDKTSDMDTQVSDEIDSIISSVSGDDSEIISFVSDKNTNVISVQFVIKTQSIEKTEIQQTTANTEQPLNFWQKLLRLFHFQ